MKCIQLLLITILILFRSNYISSKVSLKHYDDKHNDHNKDMKLKSKSEKGSNVIKTYEKEEITSNNKANSKTNSKANSKANIKANTKTNRINSEIE